MSPPRLAALGSLPVDLDRHLARLHIPLVPARDPDALLRALVATPCRAVLLCPPFGGASLASLLASLSALPARPAVFVLGLRDAEQVLTAMRHGARDCFFADRPADELARTLELALAAESAADQAEGRRRLGLPALVGHSEAIRRLREQVERVARSEANTILVQGESGTGKDLVAQLLHACSPRAAHAFVPINCSAIPGSLLESELFGHEAGAYTDARTRRVGLLEKAQRGTLFLDEVAEIEVGLQAKLLRFLEERRFRRLGSSDDITVDVRVVAGTNVELHEAMRAGRFRRDLYYRLAVVPIHVPPLRSRPEDVVPLAEHFLLHDSRRYHKHFTGFDDEARARLEAHAWPGNVRELKNAIERVVLLEQGSVVTAEMLGPIGGAGEVSRPTAGPTAEPDDLNIERAGLRALLTALERTDGNLTAAGKLLGVSRDTVRYRMERHGVCLATRAFVDPSRVREGREVARNAQSAPLRERPAAEPV